MERELGSSPRVDVNGRPGHIVGRSAADMKVKVEFDDGETEWVEMEFAQLVREEASVAVERELGS